MALPAKMRDALRLLIIVAKYRRIAVKKGESYGQRLKGVHWLMMGLACAIFENSHDGREVGCRQTAALFRTTTAVEIQV